MFTGLHRFSVKLVSHKVLSIAGLRRVMLWWERRGRNKYEAVENYCYFYTELELFKGPVCRIKGHLGCRLQPNQKSPPLPLRLPCDGCQKTQKALSVASHYTL